jgi:hypothetical protein
VIGKSISHSCGKRGCRAAKTKSAVTISLFSAFSTVSRAGNTAGDFQMRRRDALPSSLPPRGLSRIEAAAYIGISPPLFDEMVKDGRMPPAKTINSRKVWDRLGVDIAFNALPSDESNAVDDWANVR